MSKSLISKKNLARSIVNLFLVGVFIFSCFISTRLSHIFLESSRTKPAQKISDFRSPIMFFANDDIFLTSSSCVVDAPCFQDEIKDKPNYSFRVPKGRETYFQQKLAENKKVPFLSFKVEEESNNRQLIRFTSSGSTTSITFWYEADDKEIFPIKYLDSNDIFSSDLLGGLFGGFLVCIISYLAYKRFVKTKLGL